MLENQALWRLIPFATLLGLMMAWETFYPRRLRVESRSRRTVHNLMLSFINTLATRFLPIVSAIGAAAIAEQAGIGLFNWLHLPFAVEYALTIVLLDMLVYWQHVAVHRVPLLWKLHQVHHADHDLDATSGLRFHPLEILFSMLIKVAGAMLLGAPAEAVLIFEIILNGCAIFNHSNVYIPASMDRMLRMVVVTPDMHRIHHSVERDETNTNYGFSIPWWDHLFGTYRAQPRGDHANLELGIPEHPRDLHTIPVWAMLWMPFAKSNSTPPTNGSPTRPDDASS